MLVNGQRRRTRPGGRLSCRLFCGSRQVQSHHGTPSQLAFDIDCAIGLLRESVHLAETQPRARGEILRRKEGLEDPGQALGRDALSAVGNLDDEIVTL